MAIINLQCPRYGNWGGPGYSAGKDCPTGQKLSDEDKNVNGIDPMDELFKKHDIAYENAEDLNGIAKDLAILQADQDLYDALYAMDPNDSNNFKKIRGHLTIFQ